MSLESLLILGLATWRISNLLVNEDGPWSVIAEFRHLIGVRYDANSQATGGNVIARLFTCVRCLSVWSGTVVAIAFWMAPTATLLVSLPFAFSAAAIIVDRIANGSS